MGVINKTTEQINSLLDKVEGMPEEGVIGKTPVIETGTTTTLPAGSNATSEVVANGTDGSGNPKYKINFGIPKGQDGTSGGAADTIEWKNVTNKPTWVNSATKPTYTATEVGALPATTTIPSKTSQLTNDSNFTTTSSFKTVNGQSIVGSGNIEISGTGGGIADAPSDGKTYGRKNGAWTSIESLGGSVNITDIFNRLNELAGVEGTCTDEDYNTLKGYADNGVVLYVNMEGVALHIDIQNVNNIISLRYNIFDGQQDTIQQLTIGSNKLVSNSYNSFLGSLNMGDGILGSYTKPSKYSAITQDDSISTAIGKLEAGIGSGGGANTYEISSAVLDLTEDSTKDEIKAALGGDEGIAAIKTAIDNKALLYISYNKEGHKGVINVSGYYSSLTLAIFFTDSGKYYTPYNYAINAIDYIINVGFINNVGKKYKYGFMFSNKLCELTSTSESDGNIKTALNNLTGDKLYKLITSKSCNKFYISDPTNHIYIPLSVKASVSDGVYMFSFSAVVDGIWGTPIGGVMGIMYTLSSNTYQVVAINKISVG